MSVSNFSQAMEARGIHWYFVKPLVSGPLKTKVGVVERFNRTLKSILKKLIDEYNLNEKAWLDLLPKALHRYNYENVNREMHKTPADIDNRDKQEFVAR